jgi:flagellar basal body-associated protein FliL
VKEEAGEMSGSTLAIVIIPVVVVIALAAWIVVVYLAQRRPGNDKKVSPPATAVRGGGFEASGGRQVTPHRDAVPPEAHQYEGEADESTGTS